LDQTAFFLSERILYFNMANSILIREHCA
jgi:hypothetical protein